MKKLLLLSMIALLSVTSIFAASKVAFVYQSGYNAGRYVWTGDLAAGYTPSADPVYMALAANFDVTDFVYASSDTPDLETLKTYDLVVLSEAMSGNTTLSNTLVNLVGTVPMLGMKAYNYTSGRWGWATPANPGTKTTSVTINAGFEDHEIFKGVEVNDGVVEIFDGSLSTSNLIQGFGSITETGLIESDHIIANVTGTESFAIHEITNLEYKYMLIPISSDVITTVSVNGTKLVINACNYLMGTGDFDPDADFKIAYLYDSSYGTYQGIDNDPILLYTVIGEKNAEVIDIKDFTAANTDTLAALESNYDLVIVSEAMSSGHAFMKEFVNIINRVPVLNFKSFLYKNTVWNWGAGVNPKDKSTGGAKTLTILDPEHEIFANVEGIENDQVDLYTNDTTANMIQAYSTDSTKLIGKDKVLATVEGANAIHEHGSVNKYMLIPLSCDALNVGGEVNITGATATIINNAVNYLLASKGNILPAVEPTFEVEYGNNESYVSIASRTSDALIYYTTDGSEPTSGSTLYEGTITITTDATIVKAIATKQGNDNSTVASITVNVYSMSATPFITDAVSDNGKTVTITAAEGAAIYYAFGGADPDSLSSILYTAPFELTRPTIVKAVAYEKGKLASEIAELAISINNYVARNKTLLWANFENQPDSLWIWANTDSTTTTTGDVISAYAYTALTDSTAPVLKTITFENGFLCGSYGQRINLQATGVAESGDYSPATAADAGASSRAISFLKSNTSSDPANAYMITANAYRGPFDISLWMTHAKSSSYVEKIEVSIAASRDAAEWTVLDTLESEGTMKLIRKFTAYYDAKDSVYVKIASVSENGTNNNVMIFDMRLMGEGEDPIVDAVKNVVTNAQLISRRIYTISGMEVKSPVNGVNIVRDIYSDGSVKTSKIMVRNNTKY